MGRLVRKTYIWIDGKMVEKPKVKPRTFHVMSDIDEYRVVGPEYGKLITSRPKHREYLRKHSLIEVGNERGPIRSRDNPG